MNVWLQPRVSLFMIRHMAQRSFRLTPPPTLREKDVIRACLDLVRYKGYYPVRIPTGVYKTFDGLRTVTVGEPGIPDYVCVHGKYPAFFLETKRPGKTLSPHQEKKAAELIWGFHLAVAAADDVAALARWIDKHEQSKNERLRPLCHPGTGTATETETMQTASSIQPPRS